MAKLTGADNRCSWVFASPVLGAGLASAICCSKRVMIDDASNEPTDIDGTKESSRADIQKSARRQMCDLGAA